MRLSGCEMGPDGGVLRIVDRHDKPRLTVTWGPDRLLAQSYGPDRQVVCQETGRPRLRTVPPPVARPGAGAAFFWIAGALVILGIALFFYFFAR